MAGKDKKPAAKAASKSAGKTTKAVPAKKAAAKAPAAKKPAPKKAVAKDDAEVKKTKAAAPKPAKAAAKPAPKKAAAPAKAAPKPASKPAPKQEPKPKAEDKIPAKSSPAPKALPHAAKPAKGAAKPSAGKAPVPSDGAPLKKMVVSVAIATKPATLVASVRIDKPVVAPCTHAHKPVKAEKLTAKELRDMREKLILMRETILNDIRSEIGDEDKVIKGDEADMAADFAENAVSFEMARSGSKALEAIDNALQRIADGTYGQCESCDAFIPKTRLKVLPFATLCASCKQGVEVVDSPESAAEEEGDWEYGEGGGSSEE